MSRPKRMTKAIIVGHKNVLKATVDALHDSNLFHIEDFIEEVRKDEFNGKMYPQNTIDFIWNRWRNMANDERYIR